MKFKSFIFTLLAILVAGCTLEPIPESIVEQEENIVTTNVAISPETRVTYTGGTGNNVLSWESGDQLRLAGYDGTTYKGSEVFSHTGPGNKFTGTPVGGATTYQAYYPGNIITLDANGNVNPLGVDFWQQTQNGDGTTGHLKNKLLLFDETPNAIGEGFALNLKSSILKLSLSGIPAAVGTLNKLIYTVEIASGVFKSVELNVTNVTFSSDKTTLTAYIAFDPTVVTGIIAGGTVIITLSGAKSYKWSTQVINAKTYIAGKCYPGTVTTGWNEMINPLSYFAEHNMADLTGTFEIGHDASGQYLFNWNGAITYNTNPAMLNGKSYYTPILKEWQAILPASNTYVNFSGSGTRTLTNASVTVRGSTYIMDGDFSNIGNVVYATLTYTLQSAPTNKSYVIARYRTENLGSGNADARMVIDMKSTATPYTMDQAKNADWNSVGVVSRVFPAAGYGSGTGSLDAQGRYGYYWSSTQDGSTKAKYGTFYSVNANSGSSFAKTFKFSLRLVSRE